MTIAEARSIDQFVEKAASDFQQVTRQYALFQMGFFALACSELLAFILFFSFLTQSSIVAFSLAGLVLTAFCYSILLFYFQAKKPEQLVLIREEFLKHSENSSEAIENLLSRLENQEYHYYPIPERYPTLGLLVRKLSVWTHWKDLHAMKEILHQVRVSQKIEAIKQAPTNLEAHAALAAAYLSLARHYRDPRLLSPDTDLLWVSPEYQSSGMKEKFETACLKAIEEFKILGHYAPNNPWVHTQLANAFHDLERYDLEIEQYEILLKITPSDPEIIYKLGVLYFQEGHTARALQIYDHLHKADHPLAPALIAHYI